MHFKPEEFENASFAFKCSQKMELCEINDITIAALAVESGVKYSFVVKSMQKKWKGRYNADLTLSPRFYVKPPTTSITANI